MGQSSLERNFQNLTKFKNFDKRTARETLHHTHEVLLQKQQKKMLSRCISKQRMFYSTTKTPYQESGACHSICQKRLVCLCFMATCKLMAEFDLPPRVAASPVLGWNGFSCIDHGFQYCGQLFFLNKIKFYHQSEFESLKQFRCKLIL